MEEKIPKKGSRVQIHEGPYAGRTGNILKVDRKGTAAIRVGNKEIILEYGKYKVI